MQLRDLEKPSKINDLEAISKLYFCLLYTSTQLSLTNTRGLIIFLYIAMNVPFAIFFLLSFFQNLSFTFEEAAAIDGCTPTKTFWKIMFPLAQPGIITVTIFNFIKMCIRDRYRTTDNSFPARAAQ